MDFALLVLIEAKFKLPKCIILDKRVTNIGMSKTNELTFDSSSNMKYHLGKISHKRIDDKCVFVIEDTSHHGTIRVNNRKNKHSQIILKNNDFISFTSAKSYDGQENFCCKYMFFKPYELKYSLDLPKSHNKGMPENHCEKVCKGELFDSQCINDNYNSTSNEFIRGSISQILDKDVNRLNKMNSFSDLGNEIIKPKLSEHLNCPICLGSYNQKEKLTCGHTFCRDCIKHWIKIQKLNGPTLTCPVCRQEFCQNQICCESNDQNNEFRIISYVPLLRILGIDSDFNHNSVDKLKNLTITMKWNNESKNALYACLDRIDNYENLFLLFLSLIKLDYRSVYEMNDQDIDIVAQNLNIKILDSQRKKEEVLYAIVFMDPRAKNMLNNQ